MLLIECPEEGCIAPFEVSEKYGLMSTDGVCEMVKGRCLLGHTFNMPYVRKPLMWEGDDA